MFKWATFREILLPSSGRWWEKYLSKHSPLKHTCSWRDKLIVLWILKRQAKIFLRIISVLINFFFFYLHMTIRPTLGVTLTLKCILFLIVPIFCLQYCLNILSTTIIPLYFVHYIHRSAALIFCMLYPWLYKVFAVLCCLRWWNIVLVCVSVKR